MNSKLLNVVIAAAFAAPVVGMVTAAVTKQAFWLLLLFFWCAFL